MAGESTMDKKERDWKMAFYARAKDRTLYTAYASDPTKETFYSHPTKPFLYDKGGSRIGFRGSDAQPHFHEPPKGWGLKEEEMEKYRNVGPIVNQYLGKARGRMSELGEYKDVLSPLSKMNPNQDIRRTSLNDKIMNKLHASY